MGCVTKLIQGLFFIFNFLFFLLGIAVIAVGVYSRIQNDTWKNLFDSESLYDSANILIAAGLIVAVVGFLGCCGACKRLSWMLVGYSVAIILIFILEVAAGIFIYTKRDTIEGSLTTKLDKGISKNYGKQDAASKGTTIAIDWLQRTLKCCGMSGPSSWEQSKWRISNKLPANRVPKSCCRVQVNGCNINTQITNATNIYTQGCVKVGKEFAQKNILLLGGLGVGVAVVQLIGVIFSVLLCKAYKKEDDGPNRSNTVIRK